VVASAPSLAAWSEEVLAVAAAEEEGEAVQVGAELAGLAGGVAGAFEQGWGEAVRVSGEELRFTIAAHSRGSAKVLVQPLKLSLEAMATLAFSSLSVRTWNRSSAPRRSSSM
jgi:hypothetical protein